MTPVPSDLPDPRDRVHIFEDAPELILQLKPEDAALARRISVRQIVLELGTWRPDFPEEELRGHLGLLVLDGLLSRQVTLGEVTCAELLGDGDVLRPWTELETEIVSVPAETRWQVVSPTRLAAMNSRFALQIARWPAVTAAIIDRVVQRARWLAFHLAVCHIVGVEVRLLMVLWHFADRWGRVTPAGVKLPLPLSHGMLAGIVGARRPTVSTALGVLRDQHLVERNGDGWLLRGDPPEELGQLRAAVAGREPTIRSRSEAAADDPTARAPAAKRAAGRSGPGTSRA